MDFPAFLTDVNAWTKALESLSPETVALGVVASAAVLLVRKAYLSTVIPLELQHLPRVPIWDSIKIQFTPGGFIREHAFQEMAVKRWCMRNGRTDDTWRDMYLVWLFGKWLVVLGKPDSVRTFFSNTDTFPKLLWDDFGLVLTQKYLGVNVIMSNGTAWKHHRKITNPAFHRGWSTDIFGQVGKTLCTELDNLDGKSSNLFEWMQRATLDVLSLAAFGKNLNSLTNPDSDMVKLYNSIMSDLQAPYFLLFPWLQKLGFLPIVRSLRRRIVEFHKFLDSVIEEKEIQVKSRLARGEAKNEKEMDLLERMIEASIEDPATFTREDLRHNTVIFFIAGHDTTAAALTSSIYLMGLHPEIQSKARNEALAMLGTDIDASIAVDDFPVLTTVEQAKLDYITYVIKESLRIYPSVSTIPFRRTSKETVLDGTKLPIDTMIHVDFYGIHRNAKYWGPDCAQFKPERWIGYKPQPSSGVNTGAAKSTEANAAIKGDASGSIPMVPSAHNFNWIPFGGGQRLCLGMQFSIMEQRVLLAMLLARYEWTITGNENAVNDQPNTSSGVILHMTDVKLQFNRRYNNK